MKTCRLKGLFPLPMGNVAVLDFLEPTTPKRGDFLRNASGDLWRIVGFILLHLKDDVTAEEMEARINERHCLILGVDHTNLPSVGEELVLISRDPSSP